MATLLSSFIVFVIRENWEYKRTMCRSSFLYSNLLKAWKFSQSRVLARREWLLTTPEFGSL
jgi:hypothetical protein